MSSMCVPPPLKCADPSHSINGTQETVTMSLECDAQGEYAPKDADGKPLFPMCMQRGAIQLYSESLKLIEYSRGLIRYCDTI